VQRQPPPLPKLNLREQILKNKTSKSDTLRELLEIYPKKWKDLILPDIFTPEPNYIASIIHRIKTLELEASMDSMDVNMRKSFAKVFEPISHVDDLPMEPLA
jgi:hypothetical protein